MLLLIQFLCLARQLLGGGAAAQCQAGEVVESRGQVQEVWTTF